MRKNNNRSPRASKATARLTRELATRPHSFIPPMDPPTVQSNPVRNIVVDLSKSIAGASPFQGPITIADVRQQISDQMGLPVGKIYFVPKSIAAWVATAGGVNPGVSSPVSLKITDTVYGIESRDDPSPLINARVGLKYPKNIQQTVSPTSVGTTVLWILTQTGLSSAVLASCRISCDYWGSSI